MILRMDQEETDFQQTIYAINSFIKRAERKIKQREEHQARVVRGRMETMVVVIGRSSSQIGIECARVTSPRSHRFDAFEIIAYVRCEVHDIEDACNQIQSVAWQMQLSD